MKLFPSGSFFIAARGFFQRCISARLTNHSTSDRKSGSIIIIGFGKEAMFGEIDSRECVMKKILLVDDEESVNFLHSEVLEEEGYEVHSALTGQEALKKLEIISPDLVILDINMPGMNGIEVLRKIKETNPKTKVIISSSYNEYKQDIGVWISDDYVMKSADLDELKDAVRQQLS